MAKTFGLKPIAIARTPQPVNRGEIVGVDIHPPSPNAPFTVVVHLRAYQADDAGLEMAGTNVDLPTRTCELPALGKVMVSAGMLVGTYIGAGADPGTALYGAIRDALYAWLDGEEVWS